MDSKLTFTPREHLLDYEWDFDTKVWQRPKISRDELKELNKRNNSYSFIRLGFYIILLLVSGYASIQLLNINILLGLPVLYFYYFVYGFLTAISHELRHKTMLTKNYDWLQESLFVIIQTLMWQSPLYERTSHRLHHRYTMVRDRDPETDWPEVVTRVWIRRFAYKMFSRVLFIGAIYYLLVDIYKQLNRAFGSGDKMMKNFCNDRELKIIRRESSQILLIHLAIAAFGIFTQNWWILLLITLGWQVGQISASYYFFTEHLSKMYNANDQRLVTRSVKVSKFVKLLYWGLDDHIEHHQFPGVPSANLPKLHNRLANEQDERLSALACWREIYLVAAEKEVRPEQELIPKVIRESL